MNKVTSPLARQNWLDGLAISLSAACAIHCLALPLAIALMPAWSRWLDLPEELHFWLLLVAFPLSTAVLFAATRSNHRAWLGFCAGMVGLCLMFSGLFAENETAETFLTLAGALMLAGAHAANWRRRAHCRI